MRTSARTRWGALFSGVTIAVSSLVALGGPSTATPITSTIPVNDGVASGTLPNGVTYENTGFANPGNQQSLRLGDPPQTWTFSKTVDLRFGVYALNCQGETMQLPAGTTADAIADGHTWNPANFRVTGTGTAAQDVTSTFRLAGVNELTVSAIGASGCFRALKDIEVTVDVPEFDCDLSTVFVAQGDPTQLNALEYGAGSAVFVPVGAPVSPKYNSIAFNTLDNFIYGMNERGDLLRIDSTGEAAVLGNLELLTNNVGAITAAGDYYVMSSALATIHKVDIATVSSTPIALSTGPGAADLTFIGDDLWGQVAGTNQLVRVNLATQQVDKFSTGAILPATTAAGAAWTFGNGNLGISNNADGTVYQIHITDPTGAAPSFSLISVTDGPSSNNNDGTACVGLPADLSLTKTASPEPVAPGGAMTWTLTVHNAGPGDSSGFAVHDDFVTDVTNIATSTPGCTVTDHMVDCSEGPLAAGDDFVITITGNAPTTAGGFANSATVTGNEFDPNLDNNRGFSTTNVIQAFGGLCRGTPIDVLGLTPGTANDPERPCKTDVDSLLKFTHPVISTGVLVGNTQNQGKTTAAQADVATASVNIGGVSLAVTAVHAEAKSTVNADCSTTTKGKSHVTTLTLNGRKITVADQPITIPLIVGTLYINQTVKSGGTITQRAVFLDLPGTALDVIIAEAKAGTFCK